MIDKNQLVIIYQEMFQLKVKEFDEENIEELEEFYNKIENNPNCVDHIPSTYVKQISRSSPLVTVRGVKIVDITFNETYDYTKSSKVLWRNDTSNCIGREFEPNSLKELKSFVIELLNLEKHPFDSGGTSIISIVNGNTILNFYDFNKIPWVYIKS